MSITAINEKSLLSQPEKLVNKEVNYDLTQANKAKNIAIVRSQMEVSLNAGDESLTLLYKTALNAINEVLDPKLETKPVQISYDEQLDVSPKATAERIVSLSTGFFNAFQQQNKNLTQEESLEKFMSVIGGGIDQGFKDAREILESLSVLEGRIASDIDVTYDLVQKGLQSFIDNFDQEKNEN